MLHIMDFLTAAADARLQHEQVVLPKWTTSLTSTLSSFLAQRVRVEELQDNIVRKIDDVTQHNAAQSVVRAEGTTSYTNSY